MTIVSKFYSGGVNNADWAAGHRRLNYQYVVHGSTGGELAVTIDGTVTRGYKIAIGNASGGGIFDKNDAIISGSLPSNAAARWHLIGLRRNWGTLTTTSHSIEGTTTEALPAGRPDTPGVEDVHPLALAFVPAGGSAITIIRDLRLFADNSGALVAAGGIEVVDLIKSFVTPIGSEFWAGKIKWTRTLTTGTPTWVETGQETIACRVTRASNLTIPWNTTTTVDFTAEDYDTDSMHDNVTNNNRVTINKAGMYALEFTGEMQGTSPTNYGQLRFSIQLNDGVDIAMDQKNPIDAASSVPQRFRVGVTTRLAVGDFLKARIFQTNDDSNPRLLVFGDYSPKFTVTRVGA